MVVCLPLKDEAYDAIMSGRKMTYECGPDDLQIPTTTVLIESLAERPREMGRELGNATGPLAVTMTAQIGALTHRGGVRPTAIRLLSIGGSPPTIERLKSWGFVDSGRAMPRVSSVPLYTLSLTERADRNSHRLLWYAIRMLGESIYSPPPP